MYSRLNEELATETVRLVHSPGAEVEVVSSAPAFDAIALYLFQVEAKLASLSPETRRAVLEEIRQHLHASVSAREELGMTQKAATEEAIARFGNPSRIAKNLCRVWREEDISFPQAAFVQAFIVFGGCGVAVGIPAALHTVLPESGTVNIWAAALLYPIIAGFWVGWRAPRRAVLGTLLALAVLMLCSLPLTLLNVVDLKLHSGNQWLTPGFYPLLFVLWVLPGCLSASATARIIEHSKQRKTVQ